MSYAKRKKELVPIEVEVLLAAGLPTIRFFGKPDNAIKESARKIKAAIQNQGYRFPRTQQVLVNLRPHHFTKTCSGLDLAVAVAILHLTGQVRLSYLKKDLFIYGELTLGGEVITPEDLVEASFIHQKEDLLTGESPEELARPTLQVKNLASLAYAKEQKPSQKTLLCQRPPLAPLSFTREQADLMKIVAYGEHSCLFAGSSGSGKTTMAHHIPLLLAEPSTKTFTESLNYWRRLGKDLRWRPSVAPHHTSTAKSLLGQSKLYPIGDLQKAHGGALILDELLEFSKPVLEALREPTEAHSSVLLKENSFRRNFLLLATSNLCFCGGFTPEQPQNCRCSNYRRLQYLERLSGPFLDRFQILHFTHCQNQRLFSLSSLLDDIGLAQDFAKKHRSPQKPNSSLCEEELLPFISKFALENMLPPEPISFRRYLATLQVARSLADFDQSPDIQLNHLGQAASYTLLPFQQLSQRQYP